MVGQDNMRGLTVNASARLMFLDELTKPSPLFQQAFIADLRSCKVRELEEKRINKEMAHIRQKFKGESTFTYATNVTTGSY